MENTNEVKKRKMMKMLGAVILVSAFVLLFGGMTLSVLDMDHKLDYIYKGLGWDPYPYGLLILVGAMPTALVGVIVYESHN